jgi:hypothetical protein
LILLAYCALTLLFFHRLALSGLILGRGDVYAYFYPYWEIRSLAFRAGHFPLWSPDIFMGVPLLANSQIGTFYPPNWLVTPFETPAAITISLMVHTLWAMLGVYVFSRRALQLDRIPAFLAGVLYGFGGYLGGQAEHINQYQALAWMPWLFWLWGRMVASHQSSAISRQPIEPHTSRFVLGMLLWFAAGLALQFLAGHPQTVFITLVGIGIYTTSLFVPSWLNKGLKPLVRKSDNLKSLLTHYRLLIMGILIALLLAAPQLIPTLELASVSNRSGGLQPQEALAFSFNPFLIGRGLLPSYDSLLFSEYIAYSGVIGLGLAVIGVFSRKSGRQLSEPRTSHFVLITPFLLLVLIGLFLALGVYNPLNWLLANLPGFSLFRVPARWLALVAFGIAVLAGMGLHSLKWFPPRRWVQVIVVALIGTLAASSFLAGRAPEDVIGSAVPTTRSLVGWAAALVGLTAVSGQWSVKSQKASVESHLALRTLYSVLGTQHLVLPLFALLELLFASQIMAYNQVVPADIYNASRFTIRQLQTYDEDQTPPGRVLSITPLQFDPGDVDQLKRRYDSLGMSELQTRIALVATKMREVISPNLGLKWGIPGVDGFDGGLLPSDNYSAFTGLMLPPDEEATVDGRLGEMLASPDCRGACIPEQRWLNLTNTRYLITDKTADVVHDGIFYDTTFAVPLKPDDSAEIRVVPPFEATAINILYRADDCRDVSLCAPSATMTYDDQSVENLSMIDQPVTIDPFRLARLVMKTPRAPTAIQIKGESIHLWAATLIDTRTGAFQQLTLGPWQRVLSSDIKLYENLEVLPRAFVVHDVRFIMHTDAALDLMQNPTFDPAVTIVLAGTAHSLQSNDAIISSSGVVTSYSAERVEIAVSTAAEGYLLLTDAYYPGWTATVNGQTAPIRQADILFRAVQVPAGESTVVFEYRPWWWPSILVLGGVVWSGLGAGLFLIRRTPYNGKAI